MKQVIRNKTFETNSSSCHSLAIKKSDISIQDLRDCAFKLKYHIPLVDTSEINCTEDPETILSFLWTIANAGHKWELVDELKKTFPNCIFQKPQWDLPYESDTNYCDDREITSFCDIINTNMSNHFDDKDISYIILHLKEIVFSSILYVKTDESLLNYFKDKLDIKDENLKDYIDNNFEYYIEN